MELLFHRFLVDPKRSIATSDRLLFVYSYSSYNCFVFVTVVFITQVQSTIHDENVCIGYRKDDRPECETVMWDKLRWSDCYSNTPSVLIGDNSYEYNVLSEVCPWYISNKPNSTRVCCSGGQMNALKSVMKWLQQYFDQCPVCLRNAISIFCAIACDPSNSLFMNARKNSDIDFYVDMDVYFTHNYVNKFYYSCKDTAFLQERGRAFDHFCNYDVFDQCESGMQSLLTITGLWCNDIYYAALRFKITNYTAGGVIPKNMSARNDTIFSCDQSVDGPACTFGNCPAACPDIPYAIGLLEVTSYDHGIFGIFVMYNIAFIILIIVYLCITDPSSQGFMETKIFSRSFLSIGKAGCRHELFITRLFSKWGCITVNHWVLVTSIALISLSVCCAGLMFVDETTDPVELWSKQDGDASKEKKYFEEHFGPAHRTSQIIITAPNSSNFSFIDSQDYEIIYHLGGIFEQSVLNEVIILYYVNIYILFPMQIWMIQTEITNLRVPVKAANGTEYKITLRDICYQPLYPHNKNCKISSVLNYFQNDYDLLNKHVRPLFVDSGNSSFHIHYCNK